MIHQHEYQVIGESRMRDILFCASLKVAKCIQTGDFDMLNSMNCLKKVSQEYIVSVLSDYGGMLNTIIDEEYKKYFQYIQIKNQDVYMTYLDMIIDEERSDLTLVCEIKLDKDEIVQINVEDIHVM